MREIKFRAIIPERNAVIYFTLADLIDDKFSNREILWPWIKNGNKPDEFTGLHDRNGKEIYEGDVVKDHHSEYGGNGIIIWDGLGFKYTKTFGHIFCHQTTEYFEVIGNIYENPELLEEKK